MSASELVRLKVQEARRHVQRHESDVGSSEVQGALHSRPALRPLQASGACGRSRHLRARLTLAVFTPPARSGANHSEG